MLVKTFQAEEMSEALRMVKAEMGLDALILSSRKERRKGILGYFSKPYFEVTAALDPRPQPKPNPYREEAPPARELSTREEFQNSMLGPLAREVRDLKLRVEELTRKDAAPGPAAAAPEPQKEAPPEAETPRTFAREDIEELKKLLYSAVAGRESREPRPLTFPPADPSAQLAVAQPDQSQPALAAEVLPEAEKPQRPLEQKAVEGEKDRALEALAAELRAEELGEEGGKLLLDRVRAGAAEGAGIAELRKQAAGALAGLLKCAGTVRMKKNGARLMAMVGPTGVGKTTTIAKIAAVHALNRHLSVALITTDTFRVGAVEQLKTYAGIMDLPLDVVASSQELQEALARHADKDLVLIDTAGRSPKDPERLDELKGYLECQPGIETYLCLSATTRRRELDEIVAAFRGLPIGRLLFTKLDESESFGSIVDTHLKHKLPLSYFTTGQKVPEDLEIATARKLASMVIKEYR